MRRTALIAFTLFRLVAPSIIDIDDLNALPDPTLVKAPLDVVEDHPPDLPDTPVEPVKSAPSAAAQRRRAVTFGLWKRDGDCSSQPSGSGPVPSPDTPDAFQAFPTLQAMSTNAPTPDGYQLAFTNQNASLTASNYMGLYTLNSYDTVGCAGKCDQADGCQAFNMYIERDPSLDANQDNCPNPPSTTNYKCTLWGAPVTVEEATNNGQYRASFHVVMTGSNAYNKNAPPPSVNNYTGPVTFKGAVNNPPNLSTYIATQFFQFNQSQGYDPSKCADACNVQTVYNSQHTNLDGSYQTCTFFNAFVISQNGIPQGMYCYLFNQTWGPDDANYYGTTSGSNRYTVSRSYGYALTNPPNPSTSIPKACSVSFPMVVNGGFETGTVPPNGWTISTAGSGASYKLSTPGSSYTPSPYGSGGGGQYALETVLAPATSNTWSNLTLSQSLNTCPGTNYSVSFEYWYESVSPRNHLWYGDCSITLSYPYKTSRGSEIMGTIFQNGTWSRNWGSWQAVTSQSVVTVALACWGSQNRIRLDDFVGQVYNGNAY